MHPGQYIRKQRLASGLSLRELADQLGVSHVFVGGIERGTKSVPDTMVDRLAEHVEGIKVATLRKYMSDAFPVRFEISKAGAVERSLAAAFAQKAERGFSEEELKALRSILLGGDNG
jgi:transcriptional regulator with XRE-family HTH domain